MTTKAMTSVALGLLLSLCAYTAWLFPSLPEKIPTHWNLQGDVDGWSCRACGAWLMPGVMAGLFVLFLILPLISPVHYKIEPFRPVWNVMIVLVLTMLGALHLVMLQAALHPQWNVGRLFIALICFFIALLGLLMPKITPNFWMGIRTPWTLADAEVWRATHRLAGWTMSLGGLLGALLAATGASPLWAFYTILVAVLAPALYSLWLYKRRERLGLLSST